MENNKIELYVRRSFGEKFSAIFDFISENWKTLFKYFIYFMLPVSLLMSLSMNKVIGDMTDSISAIDTDNVYLQLISGYMWTMIVSAVAYIVLGSVVFGMLRLYFNRKEGLDGLSLSVLWPEMRYCLKRLVIMVLVSSVLIVASLLVSALVAYAVPVVGVMLFIAVAVCTVPFTLFTPTYMFEPIPLFRAFGRAMRLGFQTWAGVFAIIFVVGIIVYLMMAIANIPWSICYYLKLIFVADPSVMDSSAFVNSVFFSLIMFVLGVINALGMYLAQTVIFVALSIQYGHAAEKLDAMSVPLSVERFESLSDDDPYEEDRFSSDPDIDNFEKL